MRGRLLAVLGAAVITCLGSTGCVAANAQPASAAATPKVTVVAASGSYVVIERKRTSKKLYLPSGGALYSVNASGKQAKLPTLTGAETLLSGSTLVQMTGPAGKAYAGSGPESVHSVNLSSGAEGRTTLADGEDVLAAAPSGWVMQRRTGSTEQGPVYTLTRESTSGATTDLGQPFPDGTGFQIEAGDAGLVASSEESADVNGSGMVKYMSYAAPGRWITLYDSATSGDVYCAKPSSTSVACQDPGGKGVGLLALDHSKNVWLKTNHPKTCQDLTYITVGSNLVGVGRSDTGRCTSGRLYRLGSGGKLAGSKRTFDPYVLTAGFGGILAQPLKQGSVQSLAGVLSTPRVVAEA